MLGCPGRRNILRNATCSRGDTEKNDNTTKSVRVWPLGKSHDFPSNDPLLNCFNPLSANSDQQQVSPNNIHTLSRDKVMRINKMITIEKML